MSKQGWSSQKGCEGVDKKPMTLRSEVAISMIMSLQGHGVGSGTHYFDSDFWHREVEEPCILLLARTINIGQLVGEDAPVEAGGRAQFLWQKGRSCANSHAQR